MKKDTNNHLQRGDPGRRLLLWGMREVIRKRPDVVSTPVGYTGGDATQPTVITAPTP